MLDVLTHVVAQDFALGFQLLQELLDLFEAQLGGVGRGRSFLSSAFFHRGGSGCGRGSVDGGQLHLGHVGAGGVLAEQGVDQLYVLNLGLFAGDLTGIGIGYPGVPLHAGLDRPGTGTSILWVRPHSSALVQPIDLGLRSGGG